RLEPAGIHPHGRRLHHAVARWWHIRHHDRKRDSVAVLQGEQRAPGRGRLDGHDARRDAGRLRLPQGRGLRQDQGAGGLTVNHAACFNLLGVYGFFFFLLLYGPVLLLPPFSFNDSIYIAFPFKGFTLQWYREMVGNPALMAAFKNSLTVAIPVAIVSTVLGLLAAKALTRYRLPGRGPVTA